MIRTVGYVLASWKVMPNVYGRITPVRNGLGVSHTFIEALSRATGDFLHLCELDAVGEDSGKPRQLIEWNGWFWGNRLTSIKTLNVAGSLLHFRLQLENDFLVQHRYRDRIDISEAVKAYETLRMCVHKEADRVNIRTIKNRKERQREFTAIEGYVYEKASKILTLTLHASGLLEQSDMTLKPG